LAIIDSWNDVQDENYCPDTGFDDVHDQESEGFELVFCKEDYFGDGETQEQDADANPDWNRSINEKLDLTATCRRENIHMIRIVNYVVEVAGKRSIIHIIVDILLPEYKRTLRQSKQGYQKQLE